VKDSLGAGTVVIPDEQSVREMGYELIDQMRPLARDSATNAELDTIRSSIEANREGVEIGISLSDTKGNVLVEAREKAIARNMLTVLKNSARGVALGFYGGIHVRKRPLSLPFENGQMFDYKSLAVRLMEAGVSVASISCEALSGSTSWRGMNRPLPPQAGNYRVSQHLTMEEVIAKVPTAEFFWLESAKQPALSFSVTNQNLAEIFDFVLFIKDATPMQNTCAPAEP